MNATLRAEAANPETAPERLRALARQRCAREVAGNPNTPVDLLRSLVGRHFDEVLANPVLPLLLLEDPGFLLRLPARTLRRLLRRTELPAHFLDTLARHRDAEIRDATRLHRQRAPGDLDSKAEVARALAQCRATRGDFPALLRLGLAPAWIVEPLAGSTSAVLREAALSAAAPETRRLYSQLAGADGASLSAEDLAQLAEGGPWARRGAARHPNTPPPVLARLSADDDATVRRFALSHPALPLETMRAAAGRAAGTDRLALASNPTAPAELIVQLAFDPALSVRCRAIAHWTMEPAVLEKLASDPSAQIQKAVVEHRAVPPKALDVISRSPDWDLRRSVAEHPHTPPDTVARLANDPEIWVRQAIGARPDLPNDILVRLMCTTPPHYHNCARSNSSIPAEARQLFQRLPNSPDELTTALEACGREPAPREPWTPPAPQPPPPRRWRRPLSAPPKRIKWRKYQRDRRPYSGARGLPPEEYAWLARHPDPHVRNQLPHNPDVPPEVLDLLVKDRNRQVRHQLASSGRMSPASYEQLARARDEITPRMLAWNQHTPLEVRVTLAADSSPKVRRIVAGHASIPRETLAQLLAEDAAEMDAALSRNPALPADFIATIAARRPACREALAALADAPAEFLVTCADAPSPEVRAGLAAHPHLPPALLTRLAHDPDPIVRRAAAAAPSLSPEIAELLEHDSAPGMAIALAKNPRTPGAIVCRLATHTDPEVRTAVARHPATPAAVQAVLARDHVPEVRRALLFRRELIPDVVLDVFAQPVPKSDYCQDILAGPGMTDDLARELIARASADQRCTMANTHHLSGPRQMMLLEAGGYEVHKSLARLHGITRAAFAPLLELFDSEVLDELSIHPFLPVELFEEFFRACQQLQGGGNLALDWLLSHHKATTQFRRDVAGELLAHAQWALEDAAAGQDSFPVDWDQIGSFVHHTDIPIDWFEPFLAAAPEHIQRTLLRRPDLPTHWHERLRPLVLAWNAKSNNLLVRLCVLSAPDCPAAELHRAARHGRWLERYALTRNDACPRDLLLALAGDVNVVVQRSAAARLADPAP